MSYTKSTTKTTKNSKPCQLNCKTFKTNPWPLNIECFMTCRLGVSKHKTYRGYFRKLENHSCIIFEYQSEISNYTFENKNTIDYREHKSKYMIVKLPGPSVYFNEVLNVIITETGEVWNFYE